MSENLHPGAPAGAPPASPDASPACTDPPEAPSEPTPEQRLAEAEARLQEQRDAWLRALADTENVRKRAELEVAGAHRFGAERLIGMLLPVMDSLEAALATQATGADSLRAGVELTLRQLKNVFERAGVVEINPVAGDKFDPRRHQAMAAVDSDADPNTVVDAMQKGYALHERVVRPALVSVAKARAT